MSHAEEQETVRKIHQMFRQHNIAPDDVVSPLYRQLTQEWANLHTLPSTSRQVRRWARKEPALAGYSSPGEIVDAIDAADTDVKSAMLLALIRLFQAGHQLAGRVVLQSFLPKLCQTSQHTTSQLCTSSADTWVEDRRHITMSEFWAVMADYPTDRRTSSVAANLVLDTLHRVSGVRVQPDPEPVDPYEIASGTTNGRPWIPHASAASPSAIADGITHESKTLDVVHWGIANGVLSQSEAQLIVLAYLPGKTTGFGFADAAHNLGMTQAAVRQRCSRAIRRLADAVREELGTPTSIAASALTDAAA